MPIRYDIRFQGIVEGNLSGPELRERARSGVLTPQHEVCIQGTEVWFPAEELVGLWISEPASPFSSHPSSFDPRRWSTMFLAGLYTAMAPLQPIPQRWTPTNWSDVRLGILASILVMLLGEYVELHRPFLAKRRSAE